MSKKLKSKRHEEGEWFSEARRKKLRLPAANSHELPQWLSGKKSFCNAGDVGSIPGLGRSPGVENGNPLQYSCLKNPKDRGAW